ncbi:MAG: winged helix-turn-helix domain-containing protein [Desulfurococcales archaeon]|nr:winged helix-turn-helix domain-containing protein [Desulfurococcales archaeon]
MPGRREHEDLLSRIDKIEKILHDLAGYDDSLTPLIIFLVELGLAAPIKVTSVFKRMKKAYQDLISIGIKDEITRSIISILASKGELHVSELEREMRRVRGSASRRIIYDRLRLLEKTGFVSSIKRGNRRYVKLSEKYS